MKLAFTVLVCLASASPEPVDQILKSEIELAATESRHLADELAGMLARLEIEEDRDEAVSAAVLGEQDEVEEALKEMVEKIEKLAEASEDTSTETVTGLVKKKRVKEQELRKTLEQLEVVASQIEEAAGSAESIEDVNSIDKIAKLLQSISDKVKNKNEGEDDDEEVFRRQFAKDQSKTGLELNGIAEMIKSLEKVTNDLNSDDSEETDNELDNNVIDIDEASVSLDNRAAKLGIDEETSRRVAELLKDVRSGGRRRSRVKGNKEDRNSNTKSRSRNTTQRPRKGKQIDDGLESEVFENDAEIVEEEEKDRSSGGAEEPKSSRKGKSGENEDTEVCEEKINEDKVRVCLPKTKTSRSPIRLPTAKLEESAVCLDIGRTVCNESSAVLSREVCTYEYQQADVQAPVQTVDLTFQPRVEKLGVTRCHVAKEKQGYRHVEVERCVMEYIDAPYILPDLAINVDDFLTLQLPEPDKRCTVFQYELPEVICGEHTRHQCVNVAHLKPYQVTEYADTATLGYTGECNSRVLSQTQQLCTIEKKVKHHRRPTYHSRY